MENHPTCFIPGWQKPIELALGQRTHIIVIVDVYDEDDDFALKFYCNNIIDYQLHDV